MEDDNTIDIRLTQCGGRRTVTTVEGLPQEIDVKKVLRALTKKFCCGGKVVDDPVLGKVIQVQGDQRKQIEDFLVKEGITAADRVKVHGF